MADIRMLQEQSQQLQNLIGSLTDALKAVNTRLDDQAERDAQGVRRSEAGDRQPDERRARRSARRSTTTTCASARSTQEIDALRQALQQMARRGRRTDDAAIRADAAAPGRAGAAPPAPRRSAAARIGASPQKLFDTAYGRLLRRPVRSRDPRLRRLHQELPEVRQADDAQVNIGNVVHAGRQERQGGRGLRPGDPHLPDAATRFPTRTTRRGSRCRTSRRPTARAKRSEHVRRRRDPDTRRRQLIAKQRLLRSRRSDATRTLESRIVALWAASTR